MTKSEFFPFALSAAELAALPPLPALDSTQFALLFLLAEFGVGSQWLPEGVVPFLSQRVIKEAGTTYTDYRQGLRGAAAMVDAKVLDFDEHYGTYTVTEFGASTALVWAKSLPEVDSVYAAIETAQGRLGHVEELDYLELHLVAPEGLPVGDA